MSIDGRPHRQRTHRTHRTRCTPRPPAACTSTATGAMARPTGSTSSYPSTERVVGCAAQASTGDAAAAAAAARVAQPGWENTDPHERAVVLDQISRLITARSGELAALTMTEGGFTRPMAGHFADQAAAYFAVAAKATVTDHSVPTSPVLATRSDGTQELVNGVIQRRPVGVVACIVPFNGPLFGVSMKAAPAGRLERPRLRKARDRRQRSQRFARRSRRR